MFNLMTPTNQAKPMGTKVEKDDSGKKPKLYQVAEWGKKNLGRTQAQSGPMNEQ